MSITIYNHNENYTILDKVCEEMSISTEHFTELLGYYLNDIKDNVLSNEKLIKEVINNYRFESYKLEK